MKYDSHFTNNEILIQMYCNSIDIMWGLTSGTFVIHCKVLALHSGRLMVSSPATSTSAQWAVIWSHIQTNGIPIKFSTHWDISF